MKRIVAAAAAALVLAAVAACFVYWDTVRSWLPQEVAAVLGAETEDGGGERDRSAVAVRLAPVELATALDRFETSAEVTAAEAVEITSEVAGRVETVLVEDGQRLEKGAPVIRFDDASEQAAVNAARAALAEAEAALGRSQFLFEKGVATEARLETDRAARSTARAELEAAQARLEDRRVRAPFAGEVGFVAVDEGAYLSPGQEIVRLKTTDDLRLRFDLPLEVAEQAAGIGALRLVSGPEGCRQARLLTVSPLGDPTSRTRRFEAALPDGCDLTPGAFITVAAVTGRCPEAVFVPHKAVERRGFESFVFRAEETDAGLKARRTLVKTGVLTGRRIEIREGLDEGDRVVAEGLQKIEDGAAIRPAGEEARR
ncbi:efflux RND transporter periplasmic adaptor subunit [Minwuia thermotolerans]|uniref:Uncharacterized protein n=1 Tax=Minwuia thermotolerans TaxID=2056226 RepID=A0A2M9G6P0_9PROT|nr:efflux RND transporter periplasmic adaptor subunit [Minwuia thermotolerans]PJK31374.1 hypothetical protein CVT23_01450 [Minwuia thermotolerans]